MTVPFRFPWRPDVHTGGFHQSRTSIIKRQLPVADVRKGSGVQGEEEAALWKIVRGSENDAGQVEEKRYGEG